MSNRDCLKTLLDSLKAKNYTIRLNQEVNKEKYISSQSVFEILFKIEKEIGLAWCQYEKESQESHCCRFCCNIYDDDHVSFSKITRTNNVPIREHISVIGFNYFRRECIYAGLEEWFAYMSALKIRSELSGKQTYLDKNLASFKSRDGVTRKCKIDDVTADIDFNELALNMERRYKIRFI